MDSSPAVAPASLEAQIRHHLLESAAIQRQVADQCAAAILDAAGIMAACFRAGGKALLCGNGGSAADCQHMATELVSSLAKDRVRPGLPAVALTTDTSLLTAYANDYGFDGVFRRQVEALGKPGDVLIAISTSGNSPNVLQAAQAANDLGLRTIALTGEGGQLAALAECAIVVPSRSTQYIQESLLAVEHLLCGLTEQLLFDMPSS